MLVIFIRVLPVSEGSSPAPLYVPRYAEEIKASFKGAGYDRFGSPINRRDRDAEAPPSLGVEYTFIGAITFSILLTSSQQEGMVETSGGPIEIGLFKKALSL